MRLRRLIRSAVAAVPAKSSRGLPAQASADIAIPRQPTPTATQGPHGPASNRLRKLEHEPEKSTGQASEPQAVSQIVGRSFSKDLVPSVSQHLGVRDGRIQVRFGQSGLVSEKPQDMKPHFEVVEEFRPSPGVMGLAACGELAQRIDAHVGDVELFLTAVLPLRLQDTHTQPHKTSMLVTIGREARVHGVGMGLRGPVVKLSLPFVKLPLLTLDRHGSQTVLDWWITLHLHPANARGCVDATNQSPNLSTECESGRLAEVAIKITSTIIKGMPFGTRESAVKLLAEGILRQLTSLTWSMDVASVRISMKDSHHASSAAIATWSSGYMDVHRQTATPLATNLSNGVDLPHNAPAAETFPQQGYDPNHKDRVQAPSQVDGSDDQDRAQQIFREDDEDGDEDSNSFPADQAIAPKNQPVQPSPLIHRLGRDKLTAAGPEISEVMQRKTGLSLVKVSIRRPELQTVDRRSMTYETLSASVNSEAEHTSSSGVMLLVDVVGAIARVLLPPSTVTMQLEAESAKLQRIVGGVMQLAGKLRIILVADSRYTHPKIYVDIPAIRGFRTPNVPTEELEVRVSFVASIDRATARASGTDLQVWLMNALSAISEATKKTLSQAQQSEDLDTISTSLASQLANTARIAPEGSDVSVITVGFRELNTHRPRGSASYEMEHERAGPPRSSVNGIFVALGSNVGNRVSNVDRACRAMDDDPDLSVLRTSNLYETRPMYVEDQAPFLNGVCEIVTALPPQALLARLQAIEQALGRVKTIDKGPRNIDLDILLYRLVKEKTPHLTIPHEKMREREFVLRPLSDVKRGPLLGSPYSVAGCLKTLPASPSPMYTFAPLTPAMDPIRSTDPRRSTHVMSILNTTPDSFSDGGTNEPTNLESLKATVAAHVAAGATIIDIGGQSSRPNAPDISAEEEIARVLPAIEAIKSLPDAGKVAISVDTYRAVVAEAAVRAGAHIINDISAGMLDAEMLPTIARLECTYIMMHMRGTPATMQDEANCSYPDGLLETVAQELRARVDAAQKAGIRRWHMILDPGVGFAKTTQQNLEILRNMNRLRRLTQLEGIPWLVGSSRKGFIGQVTGVQEAKERTWGTAATVTAAVAGGADIVRVHDVEQMAQVVKMADAMYRV